jgi:uncharacterized membrane protein YdjX (TVP38/TMEM64 family)
MWMYPAVFAAALVLDVIPFMPPAWMAMVFLLVKFDLNPWLVLVFGVGGSTVGRYLFSLYVREFSTHFIKRFKNKDLQFLGQKLTQTLWRAWLFVLLYTLIPISTSPLFTAAGIAKVKPWKILPPFVCGKLVSDAVILFTGRFAVNDVTDMLNGTFSWRGIFAGFFGVIVVAGLFFVHWRSLLNRGKLEFTFRIWK